VGRDTATRSPRKKNMWCCRVFWVPIELEARHASHVLYSFLMLIVTVVRFCTPEYKRINFSVAKFASSYFSRVLSLCCKHPTALTTHVAQLVYIITCTKLLRASSLAVHFRASLLWSYTVMVLHCHGPTLLIMVLHCHGPTLPWSYTVDHGPTLPWSYSVDHGPITAMVLHC
jgi:hypothetical protein